MKIAAILDTNITSGGGFNQALSATLQMARLCSERYEFMVRTSIKENVDYLRRLGIASKYYKTNIVDKWISYAATSRLGRHLQNKFRRIGELERSLISDGVDLVYFVTPTTRCLSLQQLNYISTVWDLSHRDVPEFPEVRKYNGFLERDHKYYNTLAQSLLVLCDSDDLAERIAFSYGVSKARLLAMPFSPSPFFEGSNVSSKDVVMAKYDLNDSYYFYPAQFWAHKNHVRIIQALGLLKRKGVNRNVVFCGGDQGNLEHVKTFVAKAGLEKEVHFLGFVPADDIRGLYEGCLAVVMPSYFGPTNLPPLEAWKLGKPLIYSAYFAEQTGDAALLVDPNSASELAEAMLSVLDDTIAQRLIENGKSRLMEIEKQRSAAEKKVQDRLDTFSKMLECWKATP